MVPEGTTCLNFSQVKIQKLTFKKVNNLRRYNEATVTETKCEYFDTKCALHPCVGIVYIFYVKDSEVNVSAIKLVLLEPFLLSKLFLSIITLCSFSFTK